MTIALPLLSALFGAVTAAVIAQYLRRSRPALIIDELSRTADVVPYSAGVVPNPELLSVCRDSEFIWDPTLLRASARISEKDYVTAIQSALEEAEEAYDGLPAITEVAKSLSDSLQRNDYEGFQSQFGRETARLWPILIGGYIRGKFAYREPEPGPFSGPPTVPAPGPADGAIENVSVAPSLSDYRGVYAEVSNEAHCVEYSHDSWTEKIVQDEEGDFWIPLAGPVNLLFQWRKSAASSQLVKARSFAMRTAVAFASRFSPDLRDIANFLLTVEQTNLQVLETLQQQICEELQEYERLVIKGFVSNQGGSPVTVTNSGRLFVGLAGYSFTDEDRRLRSLADDGQIDMYIGADKGEDDPAFGSAITVDAGQVSRFVAVSKKRIRDLPDPQVLVRALTGGEGMCYFGTMVVSQGNSIRGQRRARSQFATTYTTTQPFRDSANEVQVPPRVGVFAGRASRLVG